MRSDAERAALPQTYAQRSAARGLLLDRALARFVAFLPEFEDVRAAYVFGSYAAGAVGPESDLDFLIVRERRGNAVERGRDLYVRAQVGVPYDLVVVNTAEFTAVLPNTTFGQVILKTAKRIYATGSH